MVKCKTRDRRQLLPHVGTFILGFSACLIVLRLFGGGDSVADGLARREVVSRARPPPPLSSDALSLRQSMQTSIRSNAWNATDKHLCTYDLKPYQEHFAKIVKDEMYQMGLFDARELAVYLYRFFNPAVTSTIIDVGANLGDTTARFMSLFTVSDCKRFHLHVNVTDILADNCEYWKPAVIAVEPVASTYAKLVERATAEEWYKSGFESHQVALTDNVPPDGKVRFYSKGQAGDQQGGLHWFSTGSKEDYFDVKASTLDDFVKSLKYFHSDPIFLLKIDTEGFDAHVLNSSRALLSRKAIKFIVAEYNKKWAYPGSYWRLRSATQFMESYGYQCYFLTPTHMIPLYGNWWDQRYETGYWSNFFCSPSCDSDTLSLINYYNHQHILPPASCTC